MWNRIYPNCLSYALRFWDDFHDYRIWYNHDHCINLPEGTSVEGFVPIEEYGYNHFERWYIEDLIDEYDLLLLQIYFMKYRR